MSRITAGIRDAPDDIIQEYDGAKAFQEAILTSDTCTKSCSAKISASVGEITVGGVVKGAGMIEPNMATMLAFLSTDLGASNTELQSILTEAVNKSFNRITIDGDLELTRRRPIPRFNVVVLFPLQFHIGPNVLRFSL